MSPYKDTIKIKDAFDLVQALGLSRDKAEELLNLCRQNDISSLELFGSYARGQQTQNSDIDLLVTFSKGKSLIDHVRAEKAFESLLGKKVDLITERSLSPYIAPMIKKDVKRLYYER
ncbi:nucleotidyltransferase family protein [uncultured Methanomethylovorans sp.]|uniref:nucleotidyltransferase family protein n=1 Tax=uncultured Methanomethylovorans sp. TaxID=183759 RepID=UPI002AA86B6D|nr:nucleotidyltransferase family protein [uncultured Methanomethylovorans sp.]